MVYPAFHDLILLPSLFKLSKWHTSDSVRLHELSVSNFGTAVANSLLRQRETSFMKTSAEIEAIVEEPIRTKALTVTEYALVSVTFLDKLFQVIYKVAYRCHLITNFLLRPKTRGSYVALWLDGRILFIRNSYKSVYTLPCGGIGRGETPVEAARRELLEEVGLDIAIEDFRQVWQQINLTEFKQDHIILFEVHLNAQPRLKPDGREVVWLGFRNLKDALAMPIFPPVREYLLQNRSAV
ncbi:MAG: 8-oxo-dGTP diphosphatase, partial [Urechidicola sp.]